MKATLFIYIGAALPFIWGVAHLFPTRSVVKGFGEITTDNKHIITMEWVIEGVSLIFLGLLVSAITAIDPASAVSAASYLIISACLVVLAIISLFTGYRIHFLPFRLCPFIFTSSAALILVGWYMV